MIQLILVALAATLATSVAGAEEINVDTTIRYQTMTGWEATARAWEINKSTNAFDPSWPIHAPAVAARMVNELGVNRLQLPLKSGWMNPIGYWTQFVNGQLSYTQWNTHSYEKIAGAPYQFAEFDFNVETILLPMLQQMQARGEKLYVNMIGTDFNVPGMNGNFHFSQNPAAYTAFVQAFADRLRNKYGVTLDAFEVTLEPENTDPAFPWGGVQIGNALVALRAMFNASGYPNLNLIAPSVTNAANTIPYLTAIESVPGAMAALTTAAYHRYSPGDYAAIRVFAQARGKQTAMAEWINATVDTLFDDLLIANVSSWQKWAVAGLKGAGSNQQSVYYAVDLSNPAKPVIAYAPTSAPLELFFRYVRMGAVRVEAQSPTMRTAAFVNSDETQVVVVKRAVGNGSALVALSGLRPGIYGTRTIAAGTSVATDMPDLVVGANGTAVVTLAEGYTTVYGKAAPTATPPPSRIVLIEYHHAAWNHYFVTGIPDEISKLDNGTFVGWSRTGQQFSAFPPGDRFGASVCRFFSTSFAPRSSHFYTPFPNECAIVNGNPDWSLEGVVFNVGVPESDGSCAGGMVPVYRMYNNGQGGAPNHRFTTDTNTRTQMLEQGWIPEGFGADGVGMCAPQ